MKLADGAGRGKKHSSEFMVAVYEDEKSLGSAKGHSPCSEYEPSNELVGCSADKKL